MIYKSIYSKSVTSFKEASFGTESSNKMFSIFRRLLQKRLNKPVFCSNMLLDANIVNDEKTVGMFFHIGVKGKKIRINFLIGGSSFQISSIDFWFDSKLIPTLNAIVPPDTNLVQMLDQIVQIFNERSIGEFEIISESVDANLKSKIEEFLIEENISDDQFKRESGAGLYNKFSSWNAGQTPNTKDFIDTINQICREKGISTKRLVTKAIKVIPGKASKKILSAVEKELEAELAQYRVSEQNLIQSIELLKSLVRGIGIVTNGILVTGTPGVGKTYSTQEILHKERGLVENVSYRFLSGGSMSARGLFEELHNYRDQLIVIDDNDSIFADQDAVNMLKGALQTQGTRWITYNKASVAGKKDKEGNAAYDTPFEFTGQIIMITNLVGKSLSLANPVLDRVNQVHFDISQEDLVQYVEGMLGNIYTHIDLDVKKEVFEFFKKFGPYYKSAKGKGISIRAYTKTLDLVCAGLPEAEWKRLSLNTI